MIVKYNNDDCFSSGKQKFYRLRLKIGNSKDDKLLPKGDKFQSLREPERKHECPRGPDPFCSEFLTGMFCPLDPW